MDVDVRFLEPDTTLVDTVIAWHWREWAHGEPGADLATWRARLNSRTHQDQVPFTFVAFADDEPVGCLSVTHDDVDKRFPDNGPWLSGMVVVGISRNLGIGRALVQRADEHARDLGYPEMWVWTSEAGPFYERCGYEYVVRKTGPTDNSVLKRELR